MKLQLLVLLSAVTASLTLEHSNATAAAFSYNYVETGSISSTNDSLGVDINYSAVGIAGSFDYEDDIAFTISYASGSYDDIRIHQNDLSAGITLHKTIIPKIDGFINVSLLQVGLETPIGDDDDTGYDAKAGIRHTINDDMEFDACFSQASVFNQTSNALGFGLRFKISKALSLRLGYSAGDNIESTSVKLRLEI